MATNKLSFLGTGWSFPVCFDPLVQEVRMVSDQVDIEESIRIILGTIPGERVMQPTFGCNLRRLVFETVDARLVTELNHLVYNALLDFEPRVNFLGADVLELREEAGLLRIRIDYSIVVTNTRHNMVYPFYFTEGTNLSAAYKPGRVTYDE
ncbi:MAG TPA: GPW/gp25 family protein [Dinghuibacter sp.]|jgi:phage baseplate assembly protein W|uniref:GPW/gp25 family protein n=1 Tax=Dinghuibacter sp. TaxID=2024697 RepID=UPI002C59F0CC|nr:GPW/gp25 family protein [Dinghuibacter sp.]HTJ14033.1 GPW/gp25 family protein [Dinghuibacter sp.]